MKLLISVSSNLDHFKQALVKLCKEYYRHIPLSLIGDYANASGIKLIDEDGSEWEGFLTGREGRATIQLADAHGKTLHEALQLQWYKMPSGKYELNAYVS